MMPAEIIAVGALLLFVIGVAWYLTGQILKPAREAREAQEAIKPEEPVDVWQGFTKARENHPPVV